MNSKVFNFAAMMAFALVGFAAHAAENPTNIVVSFSPDEEAETRSIAHMYYDQAFDVKVEGCEKIVYGGQKGFEVGCQKNGKVTVIADQSAERNMVGGDLGYMVGARSLKFRDNVQATLISRKAQNGKDSENVLVIELK